MKTKIDAAKVLFEAGWTWEDVVDVLESVDQVYYSPTWWIPPPAVVNPMIGRYEITCNTTNVAVDTYSDV